LPTEAFFNSNCIESISEPEDVQRIGNFNDSLVDLKLKELETQISIPDVWGFGERLVPDYMASDSASARIVQIHCHHYELASRLAKNRRILDIACGSGYGSNILFEAGANLVVGVDYNPEAVTYASRRYKSPQVNFICADAADFTWQHQFDLITCFETIEHLDDPAGFLSKLKMLLAGGGDLYLSLPIGETRHFDPYHKHVFTVGAIKNLVGNAGFDIEFERCDEIFLSKDNLKMWQYLYPGAPKMHISDLLFTSRGRRVLQDLLIQGGLRIQQLLLTARSTSSP
jgi:2-polyprenyl-3-methyl-5-hydroxy-6-metoxy-1,4-benzoquinol methylase